MTLKQLKGCQILLAAISMASASVGLGNVPELTADPLTYADLADLALPARIVAKVQVTETIALKVATDGAVPSSVERLYVSAQIVDLIRGQTDTPRTITFLDDVPRDARGKVPKLKNTTLLIFARPVSERLDEVQLDAPDAAIAWSSVRDSTVRAILQAATAPDSPPVIKGVDSAFSVAGTIPGERETQIFLQTDSRPVSLIVSRHANAAPARTVALGEIVDQGAPLPASNTLLWYQLACHLPKMFPPAKLPATADDAQAVREDYAVVMAGLGTCARGRP